MNAPKLWKMIPAVLACCVVGLASAKLPAPPPPDPAKAAAAKEKAAAAAKKEADLLNKARDRVADRYKKQKGMTTAAKK